MQKNNRTDESNVRRLLPCPLSAKEWILLCRPIPAVDGVKVEYTAVPVPLCPDDDERYLRIFSREDWKLAFHAPGDPNRICWTCEGWDPDDPEKTLLEWYRVSSPDVLNCHNICLSPYRYVAVG
jgi:hypothetical protein